MPRLRVSSLLTLRTVRMLRSTGTWDGLLPRLRVSSLLTLCTMRRISVGFVADAATAGAFRMHDFEGHGQAASVLGDTGSAFSCTDFLIRDLFRFFINSSHPCMCAFSSMIFLGLGLGVGGVGVACPSLLSPFCGSFVDGDVDDVCLDGSNSLISGLRMSCLMHVQVRMRCKIHATFVVIVFRGGTKGVRVRVQGLRFGFLVRLGVPYLIRSQKVCMSRRGLVRKNVPSRRFSRSGNFQLGVLLCPLLFVVLISLLCYLGQAVKLENNLDGCKWKKTDRSGVWFFRGAFQREGSFFFPCRIWRLG